MASSKMGSLPALRRQNLLAEFVGLKQACPEGVFVTLTPGDPTLWSGVIFVRKGPYAAAILRFQISFPDTYPSLPPLVTFSTDIFHPLITPLNTYTYSTDIQDNGTVSATDEERLPPGGFSLRHGFPGWFGRGSRSRVASGTPQPASMTSAGTTTNATTTTASTASSSATPAHLRTPPRSTVSGRGGGSPNSSAQSTPGSAATGSSPPRGGVPSFMQTSRRRAVSTYDVLRYIRSTFDDASILDSVPLEAAGNPGAWHAWRAHQQLQQQQQQQQQGRKEAPSSVEKSDAAAAAARHPGLPKDDERGDSAKKDESGVVEVTHVGVATQRRPGEWNWEHVWEERVKKGISASLSDPVLFGSASAADDVIRFLSLEESDIEAVKDNLKRTLGVSS